MLKTFFFSKQRNYSLGVQQELLKSVIDHKDIISIYGEIIQQVIERVASSAIGSRDHSLRLLTYSLAIQCQIMSSVNQFQQIMTIAYLNIHIVNKILSKILQL